MTPKTAKKKPPKAPTAKKPSSAPKSRVPNAATLRALADLKAGRLTRYADADDLFRKLGVKAKKA